MDLDATTDAAVVAVSFVQKIAGKLRLGNAKNLMRIFFVEFANVLGKSYGMVVMADRFR